MSEKDLKTIGEELEKLLKNLTELEKAQKIMEHEGLTEEDVTEDFKTTFKGFLEVSKEKQKPITAYMIATKNGKEGIGFASNASRVEVICILENIFEHLRDNKIINKAVIQEIVNGTFTESGETAKDRESKISKALTKMYEELGEEE